MSMIHTSSRFSSSDEGQADVHASRARVSAHGGGEVRERYDGHGATAVSPQNIPWGLARGMFGAIHGAELVGSPTSCRVSQCSTAFPSSSNR
jgi:hypothetical protein